MTDAPAATATEEKPAAKKEATNDYVVIMTNTAGLKIKGKKERVPDLEVGSTISLTESQAKARINKVRLKDEAAKQSPAGRKSAAENENKELKARITELETNAEGGNSRIADLEAQNVALHDENVKLKAAAAA